MGRRKKVETIEQIDLENQVETVKEEKVDEEKVITQVEIDTNVNDLVEEIKQEVIKENNTNKINAWWWY